MIGYEKLPLHVKKAWINALRGEDYSQGKTYLRSKDDAYCCLGVLCDLGSLGNWRLDAQRYLYESPVGCSQGGFVGCSQAVFLSEELRKLTGLDAAAESVLIRMNDNGSSFSEIADWIEKNL